jgi:hypothetical protein
MTPLATAPRQVSYGYRALSSPDSSPEASLLTVLDGNPGSLITTAVGIRDQSFQAFEWIVVARGVPAHAGPALAELVGDDARIRLIEATALDAATARRRGLETARSSRLLEIAAGDTPGPTAVEQALWARESGA